MMPDFRLLQQPWGLQISLCTCLAKRVPLKALFDEPMLTYIDRLSLGNWDIIKSDVRLAFNDPNEQSFLAWARKMEGPKRDCIIKVVTFLLEILSETGLDDETKYLKALWPHASSIYYVVRLGCSKSNAWARLLKDSPACATFAAVTSRCLEGPGVKCAGRTAHAWTGQSDMLLTAMSGVQVSGSRQVEGSFEGDWKLRNNKQYWFERVGGEIWVQADKDTASLTRLTVKSNRFPKGISMLRNWQILREKQDSDFYAEEVAIIGSAP